MIRIKYLRTIIEYNPALGELRWKKDTAHLLRGQTNRKGKIAGKSGQVSVNGQSYHAHIIAWMLYHKQRPESYIRFLDGNKKNIKIENMTDTGSRTDRVCVTCGARGGAELFDEDKVLKCGLKTSCKACSGSIRAKYLRDHRKKLKEVINIKPVVMPPIVRRSLGL